MRSATQGSSWRLHAVCCCCFGITACATDVAAACYPTLSSAIGQFECVDPEGLSGSESLARWDWAPDPRSPRHRECLDTQCAEPAYHVRLNYLGEQLFEYNLSFEAKVVGVHPEAEGNIALLTIGRTTVALQQAPYNTSLTHGQFHQFEVRATRDNCTVLLNGTQAAVIDGSSPAFDESNRRCGPLSRYPRGVLFGGYITKNFRAVFSKVAGEIRNVVLHADVPELTTTTSTMTDGVPRAPVLEAGTDILGACFPSQPEVSNPGVYKAECQAPELDNESDAAHWRFRDNISGPECQSGDCLLPPKNHVKLWWTGPPLPEYNLSFDVRWTDTHPEAIQMVLGLLSIGGGTMSLALNQPFREIMIDGRFHEVLVMATPTTCELLIDGELVRVLNGTSDDFWSDNWRCRRLGTFPNSAVIGGYITGGGETIYSRISGMVANVVLQAKIPETMTTTTGTVLPGGNELPDIPGHNQVWTPELAEKWSRLAGSWTGVYTSSGGSCSLPNSSADAQTCCLEQEVALEMKLTFMMSEGELWVESLVQGEDPGLTLSSGEVVALTQKRRSMSPMLLNADVNNSRGYNITVLHMPSATFQNADPERVAQVNAIVQRPYCMHFQDEDDGKLRLSVNMSYGTVALDDHNTRVILQHIHCPAVYAPPPLGGCEPGEVLEMEDMAFAEDPSKVGRVFMNSALLTKDADAGTNTTTTTFTEKNVTGGGNGPDLGGDQPGESNGGSGSAGLPIPAIAGGAGGGAVLLCCILGWWCRRRGRRSRKPKKQTEVEDIFTNAKLDTLVPVEQDQLAELSFSKRSSVSPALSPQVTTPSPGQTSSPPGTTPSPPSAGESSSDFTFNIFKSLHAKEIAACCRMEHCFIRQVDVKLVERVGSGSFGAVWRGALYGVTDVAVKVPLDERGKQDPARVESVANELRVFRRIRHPDIVLFFGGCMMSGDRLSLVLEWVNGSDLKDYSRKRRVAGEWEINLATESVPDNPIREFVLMQDVSRGMHYLHMQEPLILHRDLKPANILVETSHDPPHAKIADFGLSFLLEHTNPHSRTGTRAYMAPEVFRFEPYSSAADVFSYGCLAIFVIKGENPDPAIAQQQINELEVRGGQLALLREVCTECLYFDPRQRPHAASVYDGIMRPLGTPWTPEKGECKREKRQIYNVIRERDVLMFLEEMNPESPQQQEIEKL